MVIQVGDMVSTGEGEEYDCGEVIRVREGGAQVLWSICEELYWEETGILTLVPPRTTKED